LGTSAGRCMRHAHAPAESTDPPADATAVFCPTVPERVSVSDATGEFSPEAAKPEEFGVRCSSVRNSTGMTSMSSATSDRHVTAAAAGESSSGISAVRTPTAETLFKDTSGASNEDHQAGPSDIGSRGFDTTHRAGQIDAYGGPCGVRMAEPVDADVTLVKTHTVDPDIVDVATMVDDYAHIKPVVDNLPSILTPEQKEQAIALIKRNSDIFSTHEFDVDCTKLLTATVETGDHPPIAEPLRRHARVHLDVIDETIERMERANIVSLNHVAHNGQQT